MKASRRTPARFCPGGRNVNEIIIEDIGSNRKLAKENYRTPLKTLIAALKPGYGVTHRSLFACHIQIWRHMSKDPDRDQPSVACVPTIGTYGSS